VFPGEIAHGLVVDERPGDLGVAVRVVIEQPGGHGDGRIQERVADRLGPRGHLQEVAEAVLPERGELIGRRAFLRWGKSRAAGEHLVPCQDPRSMNNRVEWMPLAAVLGLVTLWFVPFVGLLIGFAILLVVATGLVVLAGTGLPPERVG
jgi:hypothetical protein